MDTNICCGWHDKSSGLLFGEQFGSGDSSPTSKQNSIKSALNKKDIYYCMEIGSPELGQFWG